MSIDNNTTTTANSTTTTTCGAFLFNSLISVESHPEQVGTICPDTIINYLVAGILLSSTLFLFISSLYMLIVYRFRTRNHHHSKQQVEEGAAAVAQNSEHRLPFIRARNPMIMLINLLTSASIATFHTLRYLIGRKIVPCSLLGLSYFLIPPVMFLPTLLRSSRLFNMARINSLRTNSRAKTASKINIGKRISQNSTNTPAAISSLTPTTTNTTNTEDEMNSITTVTTPTVEVVDGQFNKKQPNNAIKKVEFKVMDMMDDYDQQPHQTQNDVVSNDSESMDGSTFDMADISKSTINQLKILNFLVSNKFILVLYFCVLSSHILLWVLLGGIEEGIYQANPSTPRVFTGLLNFTSGCVVNTNTAIVVICQASLYFLFEVILLILCFFSDRDTYMIKLETFVVVLLQFGVILFFGLSQIGAISYYTEYFYAGGNIISTFAVLEIFASNFLPLALSIYQDIQHEHSRKSINLNVFSGLDVFPPSASSPNALSPITTSSTTTTTQQLVGSGATNENQSCSSIIKLLKHKKFGEQFLTFAKNSYCPENILCWRDIQSFKRVKKAANRRKIGQFIVKTYLLHNSPLELNISKDDKKIKEIEQILAIVGCATNTTATFTNKSQQHLSGVPSDLFDFLQLYCLLNMLDIYERIKSSNKEIREYLLSVNKSAN